MSDIKDVAARVDQSKADKAAKLSKLLGKKRKSRVVKMVIEEEEIELTFSAISSHELDKLRGEHPPTVEQKANGMTVNQDTFQPALVAACMSDPEMTYEEAKEMWSSEHWSTGELAHLFEIVSSLCLEGMNIPRNASA